MIEPKENLYSLLSGLDVANVYQRRPEVIKDLPAVTFYIAENRVNATLDKEIGYQSLTAVIDIWADTSVESGEILQSIESELRDNGYLLDFCSDIDDPDGISHISTRFNFVE